MLWRDRNICYIRKGLLPKAFDVKSECIEGRVVSGEEHSRQKEEEKQMA